MKLYFFAYGRKPKRIAELPDDSAWDAVLEKIADFCADNKYEIPYVRMWNRDGETWFDVGSHTEFFYTDREVYHGEKGSD